MEIRKAMPDEVKNQTLPDGRKRVVTEKIPEKYLKKLQENEQRKQELLNKMLGASIREIDTRKKLRDIQQRQEEIKQSLIDNQKNVQAIINNAFKKMKLGKQKDREWQVKHGSFVGVINPPRPKQEKK